MIDEHKIQAERGTLQGTSRVMAKPAGRVQRLSRQRGSGQSFCPNLTGREPVLRTVEVALCGK